jgi:hypothetical protein
MEDFNRKFSNSRGEQITCNMAITRDPTTGTISVDNPVEDITWNLSGNPEQGPQRAKKNSVLPFSSWCLCRTSAKNTLIYEFDRVLPVIG